MNHYAGAYGGISVLKTTLLKKEYLATVQEKNFEELMNSLYETAYKKEFDMFSTGLKYPDAIDSIANAHMAGRLNEMKMVLPLQAMPLINAYYRKYDIESIKGIMSAKVLGHDLKKLEEFIAVEPGSTIGAIKSKDLLSMINEQEIEGVINYLGRFVYGSLLLENIDSIRAGSLYGAFFALDSFYFKNLLKEAKKQGNKGMLQFAMELIDAQNLIAAIKAVAFKYDFNSVKEYFIEGGSISAEKFGEMVDNGMDGIRKGFLEYAATFEAYDKEKKVADLDAALKFSMQSKNIKKFVSKPMSLEFIFGFILMAERERDTVRNICYRKYYGLQPMDLSAY